MNQRTLKKTSSGCFASGPVKKVLDWHIKNCNSMFYLSLLGRSHRSKEFLKLTTGVVSKVKSLLNIPNDYKIVTLTGGATAAMELALWNLLGPKSLDCLVWEFFGELWYNDIVNQLKIKNVNLYKAEFGEYPNLDEVNFKQNDIIFVYSGSTSGIIFNDIDKIPLKREGLVISDVTSYVFLYDIPWEKIDVAAFSWQKVIAGEAAHGMLVLSPNAMERLSSYTPSWPIPKLFRLKNQDNELIEELFDNGICLNTPSALAFIDADCNLDLIIRNGGIKALQAKLNDNYNLLENWVNKTSWIDFLAKDKNLRSKAIACLVIKDKYFSNMQIGDQKAAINFIIDFLSKNKIAYDISMYRFAPIVGFRIWIGPTINIEDIEILTKWLEIAYKKMKEKYL